MAERAEVAVVLSAPFAAVSPPTTRDHPAPGTDRRVAMSRMRVAYRGSGTADLCNRPGPLADPCVETRIKFHFGVKLGREDVRAAAERREEIIGVDQTGFGTIAAAVRRPGADG